MKPLSESPSSEAPSKLRFITLSVWAAVATLIAAYSISDAVRDTVDKNVLDPLIGRVLWIDPDMNTDEAPYLPSLF